MRYCATFTIVENMRQGLEPQDACEQAILRIAKHDPKGLDLSINFVALNKNAGSAWRHGQGIPVCSRHPRRQPHPGP